MIKDAGNEYPHTYEDKITTDRFYTPSKSIRLEHSPIHIIDQ
jgi:hypothetical protein